MDDEEGEHWRKKREALEGEEESTGGRRGEHWRHWRKNRVISRRRDGSSREG